MKRIFSIIVVVWLAQIVCAQSTEMPAVWDLHTCIDYAKAQNIDILQRKLAQEQQQVALKQAKAAWWPTLNFSTGVNFSNRPFVQGGTNTIDGGSSDVMPASQNTLGATAGLNLGWKIYDGARQTTIKQQQLATKQAELEVEQALNTLEEQVMQFYVQVLYSGDAVQVQQSMVDASRALCERGKQRLDVGALSRSDYAQLEAQLGSDTYNLVTAEAAYATNLLALKQLLELESSYDLQLASVDYADELALEPLESVDAVFAAALDNRPEIKICDYEIESFALGIKSAKSGYYPSLSLNASTGLSYNSNSNYLFADQMKSNWSNTAGVTLAIPILQSRQTKSALERARLEYETAKLSKQNEQKTLRKAIETLWLNARSAQQQFVAARAQQQASQSSFDLVSEQFNVGRKTTTDVLSEKAVLLQSIQQTLQAKYMAIYNLNMLKFYQGNKITM
ncbi:MAG: TolC family protein [Paludibacteraceae bacterium]